MGLSLKNIGQKIANFGQNAAQAGEAFAKSPYDIARGAAASVTNNQQALQNANQAKATDYSKVLPLFTRGYVQTARTIEHPFTPNSYTPQTAQEKEIFGSAPIQNVAAGVKSNYQTTGNPLEAGLYGAGQVATSVLPKVSGAIKLAKVASPVIKDASVAAGSATANHLVGLGEAGYVGGAKAAGFPAAQMAGQTFTGAEGAKKFEQADNLSRVRQLKPGFNDTLGNVLTHPTLYKDYPDISNVRVSVQELPKGAKAVYVPTKDTIAVSPATAANPGTFKSALLHETQHAIQHRENFAAGTNLSDKSAYQASAGEQEARMVQARANMTPQELAANPAGAVSGVPKVGMGTPSYLAKSSTKSGIDEVDAAIQKLQKHYGEKPAYTGNAKDVVGIANGYKTVGARLANKVATSLNKNLSEDEQKAVFDSLQGVKNAALTPRAAKVAKAIRPLYNTASDVRQAIHGANYNPVLHYAPRIERQTLAGALKAKGGVKGVINSLTDLGNLDSVFSRHRQIGKFVNAATGEAQYGKASDLGLVKHANGELTDANNSLFKQVPTNTKELTANLGKSYIEKIGHVSGIYHADTTSLLARGQALKELTTNPSAHGLYTEEQVANGAAPEGVKMINHAEFKTPEGQNLYGLPKDVKSIERSQMFGRPEVTSLPGKLYDTVSNFATQSIVLNPVFHGMNQLYQTAIAAGNMPGMGNGWTKIAANVFKVGEDDVANYLKAGGHIPDYGSGKAGWLSDLTHGATKINSKAMATIEMRLRVGLYKSSIESGMKQGDAVKNIDKFLGDSHQMSAALRRTTLFSHYFKTMAGAMGSQIAHPVKNFGSIVNTAELAAVTAAVTYGYQQATGNKNAYVRVPGELGLAKEAITSAKDLRKGDIKDAATLATNRINPVLKEGLQQTLNEDLFTGNRTSDTAPVSIKGKTVIPGGRTGHAVQGLIAPAQQVDKGAGGKRSVAELASNQAGLYTPHAKGDVAAPKVNLLNVKGDKVAQGNDPTGYKQQQAYFAGKTQATKNLSTTDLATYNQITASTSKMNDKQLQAHYALMSSNPKIMAIVTKQKQDYAKQTGTSIDPLYSDKITPAQRSEYFHLQSLPYKGDDYNQQVGGNDAWLKGLQAERTTYFNNNPIASGDVSPSERVKTPTFDAATENDLTTASSLSGAQKAQYIDGHSNLVLAYSQLANYTNSKRVAQGNAPLKLYPGADPDTTSALNTYEGLGSSTERSAWIKSNPDAYSKVQDYLTNVSEYELANSAGQDKFAGSTSNQQELKSAYSLGKYDIAKQTGANGNTVYAVNPAAAYAASSGSGSSGFNKGNYEIAKLERKQATQQQNLGRSIKRVKAPRVTLTKGAGPGAKKVAMSGGAPVLNKKVALKKSKV